mgnify:CR=1 FL=1
MPQDSRRCSYPCSSGGRHGCCYEKKGARAQKSFPKLCGSRLHARTSAGLKPERSGDPIGVRDIDGYGAAHRRAQPDVASEVFRRRNGVGGFAQISFGQCPSSGDDSSEAARTQGARRPATTSEPNTARREVAKRRAQDYDAAARVPRRRPTSRGRSRTGSGAPVPSSGSRRGIRRPARQTAGRTSTRGGHREVAIAAAEGRHRRRHG